MSQYKHSFHTRIDTIGDRNVDQPVFTADGYRGFGPFFGQGVKTGAGAAAEDEANNFYHGASVVDIIRFEGCWFEGLKVAGLKVTSSFYFREAPVWVYPVF